MTEVELVGVTLAVERTPLPRDRNPYDVYLNSFRNTESRRAMAGCLDRIALGIVGHHEGDLPSPLGRHFPWGELRYEHTMRIRAELLHARNSDGEAAAPAYVNKHLSALRRVLKEAWRLKLMSTDDYMRAVDIPGDDGTRLPQGRNIAETEVDAMLNVCLEDEGPAGTRDAAIIAFLQSTGGRRAEAATARRENYDPGSRTLAIVGKRNKEREFDIHEQAAVYLGKWLSIRGRAPGPLFVPIDRWGNLKKTHLTPGAIAHIIDKRRNQAGLPHISPHDFRRTVIGDLLDEGVDLATVQQIVGHASPTTTARYDRRPRAARKAAVEKLAHRLSSPEDLQAGRLDAVDPMALPSPDQERNPSDDDHS